MPAANAVAATRPMGPRRWGWLLACLVGLGVANGAKEVVVADVAGLQEAFDSLPSWPPPVRITLLAGEYALAEPLRSGTTSQVTLRSEAGARLVPASSGAPAEPALQLVGATDWRLEGLTFANFSAGALKAERSSVEISRCAFEANSARRGAALELFNEGDDELPVRIVDCSFTGNTADDAGAIRASTNGRRLANWTLDIKGCTFDGNAAVRVRGDGGAMEFSGEMVAVVTDCAFTANRAAGRGGAFSVFGNGRLQFDRCSFEANLADKGGAVHVGGDTPADFSGCAFARNVAETIGGGMLVDGDGTATLRDCSFERNRAGTGGGVGLHQDGEATLHGCALTANEAALKGGALSVDDDATLSVFGARLRDNTAGAGGGGVWTAENAHFQIGQSALQGNSAAVGGGGGMLIQSSEVWSMGPSHFAGNGAPLEKADDCAAVQDDSGGAGECAPGGEPIAPAAVCTDVGASAACPAPPAPWHWPCGMCLRHRCSLWGANKCASRRGFDLPQSVQQSECACACCRQACARDRQCAASEAAEPGARLALPPPGAVRASRDGGEAASAGAWVLAHWVPLRSAGLLALGVGVGVAAAAGRGGGLVARARSRSGGASSPRPASAGWPDQLM